MIEALVLMIYDDVIKGCIGEDYKRYAPYLLTAFFFVLVNNLMGLIPIFPGGANVTGNIAITLVLAVITFLFTNIFGTKEYWKEIFWPDVPTWLKAPVPMMPLIEFFGIFTKPFVTDDSSFCQYYGWTCCYFKFDSNHLYYRKGRTCH